MDSTAGKVLLPIAAGGISAYSPRYGGSGVQGALGTMRAMNDQRISDYQMNQAKQEQQRAQEAEQAENARMQEAMGRLSPEQQMIAGILPAGQRGQYIAQALTPKEPPAPPKPEYRENLVTNEYGDQVRDIYDLTSGTQKQVYVAGAKPQAEGEESLDKISYKEFKAKFPGASVMDWRKANAAAVREPKEPVDPNARTPSQDRLVESISGRFGTESAVKQVQEVAAQIDFIRSVGTSPTDDQGRIYAFAKVMDPNSVVREGEYKTVQEYSQALLEKWGFKARRVFDNTGFLTEEARKFMANTMTKRYAPALKQYKNLEAEYGKKLQTHGVKDPSAYLINYGAAFPEAEPEAAPPVDPKGRPPLSSFVRP